MTRHAQVLTLLGPAVDMPLIMGCKSKVTCVYIIQVHTLYVQEEKLSLIFNTYQNLLTYYNLYNATMYESLSNNL